MKDYGGLKGVCDINFLSFWKSKMRNIISKLYIIDD